MGKLYITVIVLVTSVVFLNIHCTATPDPSTQAPTKTVTTSTQAPSTSVPKSEEAQTTSSSSTTSTSESITQAPANATQTSSTTVSSTTLTTTSIPKLEYNQSCFQGIENQCRTEGATCKDVGESNRICICGENDFFNSEICTNKLAYNGTCTEGVTENQCNTTGAICEGPDVKICLCKEGDFYLKTNNTCLTKKEHGDACDITRPEPNDQCGSVNAVCINTTDGGRAKCTCNDTFFFLNENNTCVEKNNVELERLHFSLTDIGSNTLVLAWIDHPDFFHFNYTHINISPPPDGQNGTIKIKRNTAQARLEITQLTPGTLYKFHIIVTVNGIPSKESAELSSYTLPIPPPDGALSNITETSFIVNWIDTASDSYTHYVVVIAPPALCPKLNAGDNIRKCTFERNVNLTSFELTNLTEGIHYSVNISTWIGGKLSGSSLLMSTYTIPILPRSGISVSNVTTSGFSLEYNDRDPKFQYWIVNITNDGSMYTYRNVSKNITSVYIGSLLPGTFYQIEAYTYVPDFSSNKKISESTYTRPLPLHPVFASNITDKSFVINWEDISNSSFTNYSIIITPSDSIEFNEQCTRSNNNTCTIDRNLNMTSIEITHLLSGTSYTVNTYTLIGGQQSENVSFKQYTRPTKPLAVYIPTSTVFENNFTVYVNQTDDRFDKFLLKLYTTVNGEADTCYRAKYFDKVDNSTVVKDLEAATYYTVKLYTAVKQGDTYLNSSEAVSVSSYTSPLKPNVTIGKVTNNSIVLDLSRNEQGIFNNYLVFVRDEAKSGWTNLTVQKDAKQFTIENRTAGSMYTVYTYTNLSGIRSEYFSFFLTPTEPGSPRNINQVRDSTSILHITWDRPAEGNADNYTVNFTCASPNDENTINLPVITSNTTASTNLDPGTFCNVTIGTHFSGLTGEIILKTDFYTLETAPGEVLKFVTGNSTLTSTSFDITWTRPSIRNGIIRQYTVNIILDEDKTYVRQILFNCTDCPTAKNTNVDQPDNGNGTTEMHPFIPKQNMFHHTVSGLHPWRNYTISIAAYTVSEGHGSSYTTQTLEDLPGTPVHFKVSNKTHNGVSLKWDKPVERNGEITAYTITYIFHKRICNEDYVGVGDTLDNVEIVLMGMQPFNFIEINESIFADWNYTFLISANTTIGEGNTSTTIYTKTPEYYPDQIDSVDILNVSAYNATINWTLPCYPNGDIVNYNVCHTDVSTYANSPQQLCDTVINRYKVINTILPYRNYTVSVAASTSVGNGMPSVGIPLNTPIAKPAEPKGLKASAINATAITVSWDIPGATLFTGPTQYRVHAVDSVNASRTHDCNTSVVFRIDHLSDSCTISELIPYWNYRFTVTAIIVQDNEEKFTHASGYNITERTHESIPGTVTEFEVKAESDVTKPRTIAVSWEQPSDENKHGIIINYKIEYSLQNRTITATTQTKETDQTAFIIQDIIPGQYDIKVFAATAIGFGSEVSNTSTLEPGAPIKIPETSGLLLMQPASMSVKDDKKQIAVKLPLAKFLCNTSNGDPTEWGVIVSQANEASDIPFLGSKIDFENKKNKEYKTWFDVKDSDSIKPYIATRKDWKPNCLGHNERRRRRSADVALTEDYEIGSDGDCSGIPPNEYCNGELQPGRKYRVKTFACTSGGCTETKYSEPIETNEFTEPNLTPIIAGLVSGLIVVLAVGGVLFFMRRRQAGCFAKGDDDFETTHRSGHSMDTEMKDTRITSKQPHGFVPRQIKLADFPPFVETLKNDSGLLFADAYKMLKENSPAHPTTAAEQQTCRPKNRYTNILAFDHSRVKLLPMDDEEGSDYINANYIPGYTSPREYIATQGPIIATLDDFWRMVWEQNVDTIVMLTKLMEKGRAKCDKYWPELNEPLYYGDLVVSIQSESNLSDYTIRIIEVKLKETRRLVRHFAYLKWPDMGCPDSPSLLLDFVKAVRQHSNDVRERTGPMVVHCSAGVGRTGTFIAVDHLLQHIRDHDEVDIYNLVLSMRNQRCNMVQTEDQYVYIHDCLRDFITMDDEEDEDDIDDPVYENTNVNPENVYENTAFTKD